MPAKHTKNNLKPYVGASFSVDLVVMTVDEIGLKVLLIRRKDDLFSGQLSLPGVLVQPGSDAGRAANELAESLLGTEGFNLRQLKAFPSPVRHPLGHVVTIAYTLFVSDDQLPPLSNAQGTDMQWALADVLPPLAFDHEDIVKEARHHLRSDIHNKPYVYEFVPKHFTINEVKHVYEAIVKTEMDTRNFFRKLKNEAYIKPLNQYRARPQGGRKAQLYYFDRRAYELEQNQ